MKANKLPHVVDRTLVLYVIIGILNFIVCTALMFALFNLCGFGEDLAPLVNYGLGSLIWYFSCKYLLFRGHQSTVQQILRFIAEVVVCYIVSYYILAPLISGLLLRPNSAMYRFFEFGGAELREGNCKMSVGAVSYALLNYFGQRYFVFSDRFEHHRKQREAERAKRFDKK